MRESNPLCFSPSLDIRECSKMLKGVKPLYAYSAHARNLYVVQAINVLFFGLRLGIFVPS